MDGPAGDGPQSNAAPRGPEHSSGSRRLQPGRGEEPDGVGVGLDGPWALVLGFQGASEASVEGQEVPSRQRTAHGCGLWVRHGPHIRLSWSGWLPAACSG
jgi:hypothetical protein